MGGGGGGGGCQESKKDTIESDRQLLLRPYVPSGAQRHESSKVSHDPAYITFKRSN